MKQKAKIIVKNEIKLQGGSLWNNETGKLSPNVQD